MFTLQSRNVHSALPKCLAMLREVGIERDSRNGPVHMFSMPFSTLYCHPLERVMFWPERDANPFFHFYESLWMLSGRRDVESLTRYVPRMKDFSDNGYSFHGAYGHRWRHHFGFDQLKVIGERLAANPDDRRQVLSMWDAENDLVRQEGMKDLPCNTQAFFSVVEGALNMTVVNRSNDIILGAYGANAVHFSVLQEYVAKRAGVPVGAYWQVSNNFHAYKADLARVEPIIGSTLANPYAVNEFRLIPLINSTPPAEWDDQLEVFLYEGATFGMDVFFRKVADPIIKAHAIFKKNRDLARFPEVLGELSNIKDDAWRIACVEWITRRLVREKRAQDDGPQVES